MKCEFCLADSAKLRCTGCKAVFYCSRECQKRNWKNTHKRVCSADPLLRPFIRVEMAVERVLAKLPPMEQAPKDARCYICLDGDDGGKLMRGCACRGDSAGFVHLECLTELAMSKEASGDLNAIWEAWTECGNCKQELTGALDLEMRRRSWRYHRSSQYENLRYNATRSLAMSLGDNREVDAANQLLDEASNYVGNNRERLLGINLLRAKLLKKNGQNLEVLGLLQAMLPEAKVYTTNPILYGRTMKQLTDTLLGLHQYHEAYEMATEWVAFAKGKFGLDHSLTLVAMGTYATACAGLGRYEEAKATFEDVISTQTRVLGSEHPDTHETRKRMFFLGFGAPSTG